MFQRGSYLPLSVNGTFANCCVAFVREDEGKWIVVVVPRLSSRVGFPPIGAKWQDTEFAWPDSLSRENAREIFTGRELRAEGEIKLSDAMATLPFAVYTNT